MRPSGPPRAATSRTGASSSSTTPPRGPPSPPCTSTPWASCGRRVYKAQLDAAHADPDAPESVEILKVQRSAQWLADHFEQVPLYLFPFSQHDPTGGSIYPAVWNAMLAARAEGIGSCLTALLQFFHPAETFEILGVPTDEGWILSGTVSFGYPTGTWGVAPRRPVHEVSHRNTWGSPVGFEVPQPLWPA